MSQDRRVYTDEQRLTAITAVKAMNGNITAVSDAMGVPSRTLRHWVDGDRQAKAIEQATQAQLVTEKSETLAQAFEKLAWTLLEKVNGRIDEATFGQLMVGLGIAVDKMRILRNLPTAINGESGKKDVDLSKLTEEQLKVFQELMRIMMG